MTLGLRTKLFLAFVGVIVLSTLVGYSYLRSELIETVTGRIRNELLVQARLAAEAARRLEPAAPVLDALAGDLARSAGSRVTFIREDGVVLGDSAVSTGDLGRLENHAVRKEVREALASGVGTREHASTVLSERMFYVAVPFEAGGVVAVARVALPTTEVADVSARLNRVMLLAFVLALGVAVVMSSLAAELSSRSARALTAAAREMSQGNLQVRTNAKGTDEFAALGAALDRLAENLSSTLGELRAERDRLEAVLTGMKEGLLLLDGDGRVALVNPALREMLLLGADVVGKSVFAVIRHANLLRLLDGAGSTLDVVSGEIELSGLKPRRLMVHVVPLGGETRGLLAVFVDVTHLRRLESMRRDFVANASHELRTPIAAVQSAAETLEGAAANDPVAARRFIEIISRNADRLRSLVDDLLELSKIESQEFQVEIEPLSLTSVVRNAVDLFQERAAKRGIELTFRVEPGELRAMADRRATEHVIVNLVDNAVKYCGPGARVSVNADRAGEVVVLEVADDGPGISEDHLPRIFERFYRVDAGRSRELGGTGLGLSIVKHLVEAMGGTVSAESRPGVGTRFRVTLGVASEAESEPSRTQRAS